MRNISEDERKFLGTIQGTFKKSKTTRISMLSLSIFWGIGGLILFLFTFFEHGFPRFPLTGDQWTLVVLTPLSIGIALFIYLDSNIAYQFDGTRIVSMRGDRVRKTINIKDITSIGLTQNPLTLHMRTPNQFMSIVVTPDLAATVKQLVKKSAETPVSVTARTDAAKFSDFFQGIIIEFLVPGILLSAIVFVISLFYLGRVAEYLRFGALLVFLVLLVAGVLRAFLIFVVTYFRNKKQQKME